jgi:DNA helicase-2/ATP-dependent DNA helicase PcrA
MTTDVLEGLNPAQREAAEHVDGPLLIIAGPGSGKTRVIVQRIAYLVRTVGISPRRITAVTFTNKAARELQNRLARILGADVGRQVNAGTFHGQCARILRQHGSAIGLDRDFSIYDRDDQLSLLKRAFEAVDLDPKKFPPPAVLNAISQAKAQLVDVATYRARVGSYFEEVVQRVYGQYETLLGRSQAVDFDDLLLKVHRLFSEAPEVLEGYQERTLHLHVDEFQDTNVTQYAIARQLSGKWRNICVVGDPDQSIYAWRNADIRNILSFQKDYPEAKTVRLDTNYRSTPPILDAAQRVIAVNKQRLENPLVAEKSGGHRVVIQERYTESEEASWVLEEIDRLRKADGLRYSDVAVAYRVNAQSRALEEACLRYGVPYRLVGALRFYQRKEIKDIVSYLRLLVNPADEASLTRVVNVPPRGIGQRTVDELVRMARSLEIPLSEALARLVAGDAPEASVPPAGRGALARFQSMLEELATESRSVEITELLDSVVARTGYKAYLEEATDGEERLENLRELRTVAAEFTGLTPPEGLTAFLEQTALVSDQDNLDQEAEALTLITLHQAKGLEFPVVFMVGMEEGLLPHIRSMDDPAEMEEERRLCYVGMTRAKDRLYLVRAFRRTVMGSSAPSLPSRFLRDIPPELIETPGNHGRKPMQASMHALTGAAAPTTPESPPFKSGDRVRHPTFGDGMVVSCTASRGDYEMAIAFVNGGVKRLLHSMARLEKA